MFGCHTELPGHDSGTGKRFGSCIAGILLFGVGFRAEGEMVSYTFIYIW
jgi:hypothetical protein